MQPQTQQLDPTVVNMARAIKATETSGQSDPYNAVGKSGEYGAYQYTPETWQADSQKYLGQAVPLPGASIEQQNRVAYGKIQDLKNQGYNPLQVASIWNSGKPDPTGNVGTNSKGVGYNTPQYATSVVNTYNQFKSGLSTTIQPTASTVGNNKSPSQDSPQEPSLGQELSGRLSDAGQALSDASSGKINPVSGIVQAVGAGAGAIGDVVNKGLELIPGVKWLEGELGQGVGALAQTPVGQAVVSQMQSFSKAHPELSADIGAGFNIATAIPILKGLGVVKDLAMTGIGQAFRGIAEKGIANEISGTAARTVAGRAAVSDLGENLGNVIQKGIIETGAIPDIADGKYAVSEALAKNEAQRGLITENELQPLLDKVSTTQVSDRMPLENLRQEAVANAKNQLQDEGAVNKMFDRIQSKYGDYPTLSQMNEAKKLVSKQVPQRAFDLEGYNANYNVRQTLQMGIEDGADKMGLGDVNAINAKMRLLYQADKLLESMDGKPVKVGIVSKLARKGASVGAGMLADKLGGGVVGGLGAGYLADIADKGIQSTGGTFRRAILNRTAPGAFKNVLKSGAKNIPGLLGGVMAQKQLK